MITKTEVIKLITKKIPSSQVFVENIKGNDHLQVTVIASEFNGLSLVKQHQLLLFQLELPTVKYLQTLEVNFAYPLVIQ